MARKRLGRGGTAKTITVTVSPLDYAFLEGLAAEVAHLQGARGTTSAAIRFLISEEQKRKGRVVTDLHPDGTIERQEAVFEVGPGDGHSGGVLVRRLNLQTGAVAHMIRTQDGPFTIEDRVEKPKGKRR